jgi:hypothetical protein
MEAIPNGQLEKLNRICMDILKSYPETIGVALLALDCGCIKACGVSAKGDPVGEMMGVTRDYASRFGATICLACRKKGWMNRVVRREIFWPGSEAEKPDKKLRMQIGRHVFGVNYSEDIND